MYTDRHAYIWKEEKDHLEFEIAKAEGQLRNCKFRIELVRRELILCISLIILPLVIVWFDYILPRGISGNYLFLSGRITMGMIFQTAYLCFFPFFVFYAIKAFIIWIINKRKPLIKEPLKEFDIHSKEPFNPEPSYAIEEEKLTRVLTQYYKYRNQMEQLRRDLINNDLDMTPVELREELDKIIYFQEIIPSNPFTTEYSVRTKMVTIVICVIAVVLWVKSYQKSNDVMEDMKQYMQEEQNEGSVSLINRAEVIFGDKIIRLNSL